MLIDAHPYEDEDHPRVCGEHQADRCFYGPDLGSSPRMRGAPRAARAASQPFGIIPAYAGSTFKGMTMQDLIEDHPRVCGEHTLAHVDSCISRGSSPRMRGALTASVFSVNQSGIIPAYAGSTRPGAGGHPPAGDHPRVCGEHLIVC